MKKSLVILVGLVVVAMATLATYGSIFDNEKYKYSWLNGRWVGDGFGGSSESIWSAPSEDGTMVGVYRHFDAEGVADFYQFLVLDSEGMHIKHFSSELVGWEKKEDHVTFKMISSGDNKIEFEGLVYEKVSGNELKVTLQMNQNGKIVTEVFTKRRAKLLP